MVICGVFRFALRTFAFHIGVLNFEHDGVQYFDFINIKKNIIFDKNQAIDEAQMHLKNEKVILKC
jgi:hypothetical protein